VVGGALLRRRGGRPARIAAPAALAFALAACGGGGPPADLFVVTRSGDVPGARLVLRVTDDGRASCNGGALTLVASEDLIDARQIRRDLEGEEEGETGPADEGLSLPPGPMPIFRYAVRGQDGTVSFSDTSEGQPQTFRDIAALTRRIAKGPCGLPR